MIEVKDIAKHPTMHRAVLPHLKNNPPKNHCVQSINSAEFKQLFPRQIPVSQNLSSVRSHIFQDYSEHTCIDHLVIILIELRVYNLDNIYYIS